MRAAIPVRSIKLNTFLLHITTMDFRAFLRGEGRMLRDEVLQYTVGRCHRDECTRPNIWRDLCCASKTTAGLSMRWLFHRQALNRCCIESAEWNAEHDEPEEHGPRGFLEAAVYYDQPRVVCELGRMYDLTSEENSKIQDNPLMLMFEALNTKNVGLMRALRLASQRRNPQFAITDWLDARGLAHIVHAVFTLFGVDMARELRRWRAKVFSYEFPGDLFEQTLAACGANHGLWKYFDAIIADEV